MCGLEGISHQRQARKTEDPALCLLLLLKHALKMASVLQTRPCDTTNICSPIAQVTEQIKQKTGHLPGVSIAVMGCIVNGPGEMADADFGYVGGAPGKIDL